MSRASSNPVWISFDAAETTGFAVWRDMELLASGVITKTKPKVDLCEPHMAWKIQIKYSRCNRRELHIFETRAEAFLFLKKEFRHQYFLFESIAGAYHQALIRLGQLQGWIAGIYGFDFLEIRTINSSTWRSATKHLIDGEKWPSGREAKKKAAKSAVLKACGIDASEDEADAILIGVAHLSIKEGIV